MLYFENNWHIIVSIILFVVVILVIFYAVSTYSSQDTLQNTTVGVLGSAHDHVDFMVVLNGQVIDFTKEEYQNTSEQNLSNFVHLHDGAGDVIHKHASGVTLDYLFDSLNMSLGTDCFVLDDGQEFCDNPRLFVNGIGNFELENYEFNDLDKVLVVTGATEEDIKGLSTSISDNACIYSQTCPERGPAPDESSCIGTDCLA